MDNKCLYCGELYHVKPSHASKSKYCSVACMGSDFKTRMRGENNPNYVGGVVITHECPQCGSEFLGRHERVFCSYNCHNESMKRPNSVRSKTNNKRGKPKNWACKVCSATVSRRVVYCKPCRGKGVHRNVYNRVCKGCAVGFTTRDKRRGYCSSSCYLSTISGDRNPNYKGGVTSENKKFRASEEYGLWRSRVFTRDGYRCRDCGQKGGSLHAHHIKSFSKYPDLRLDVDNGVTLCHPCHSTYHPNMNLPISR